MSTTTDATLASPRPLESAPSFTVVEAATASRIIGTTGLFFLVLGAFAIGAHRIFSTPRMIGEGYGFLAVAFGLALMLYHAARDNEPEMRRLYGLFSMVLLILALAAGLVPGPVFAKGEGGSVGFNLPWSVAFGFVGLAFFTLFLRNETDPTCCSMGRFLMLGIGLTITVGSVLAGGFSPNFLAGPGSAIAVLGLAFLCAYFGSTDTSTGRGYQVAIALGIFGLLVFCAALGRTIAPAVLSEGPQALRKPNGALDAWKVLARIIGGVIFLAPAAVTYFQKAPRWTTVILAILGFTGVGVLVAGSFSTDPEMARDPFLVPRGVILMALGLFFITVSLGVSSDSQLVTLARRELGSYFTTPIGYIVILGMAIVEWYGYQQFFTEVLRNSSMMGREIVIPEPIVRFYFVDLLPVLALLLLVPALTMRLIADERRSGSLEVLLTAPVSEATVIVGKFLATWLFFMITWLPASLFLIVLRIENGEAFDYRPLLSFYLALAACGAGFLAMGIFFSCLSPNQVVSAVLTLVGMIFFLVCYFQKDKAFGLGPTIQVVMTRFSFVDLWMESLKGQLPLKDVIAWFSFAGFWLFASVKVLEARRWR